MTPFNVLFSIKAFDLVRLIHEEDSVLIMFPAIRLLSPFDWIPFVWTVLIVLFIIFVFEPEVFIATTSPFLFH